MPLVETMATVDVGLSVSVLGGLVWFQQRDNFANFPALIRCGNGFVDDTFEKVYGHWIVV